jgi:hypothetical protein
MKGLFMVSAILFNQLEISTAPKLSKHSFIDPTGTYILKGTVKKNTLIGHSGEIRVKLLWGNRIALCFYINSGYPDYASGAFMDTLIYEDNLAKYNPVKDQACSILFCFSINSAETEQLFTDPHSGCGFGDGVMVSAIFEKYSGDTPVIQDLSPHGKVL